MIQTILLVLLLLLGANIGFTTDVAQCQENDELGFLQTSLDVKSGSHNLQLAADIHDLEQETPAQSNVTAISQQEHKRWRQPDCMENTGGDCMAEDCDITIGPTYCEVGVCKCQEGHCSGADGRCYKGPYKLLLDNVRIRSYRWGEYYMCAKPLADDNYTLALRVSKDNRTISSLFRLYEMPDGSVVMTSKEYPQFALSFREDGQKYLNFVQEDVDLQKSNRRVSTQGSTSRTHYTAKMKEVDGSLEDVVGEYAQVVPTQADWYAMQLIKTPGGTSQLERTGGAVMIGAYRFPGYYVYFPRNASAQNEYDLDVEHDDQGDSALWVFDPPLPAKFALRPFEG